MAQWSQADRTIYAKIVYYGPAFGGKTTNLESLHRITDPQNSKELLSVETSDDRTLFFDLLPFDLGEILGYQVALKVYTVPGQVRYDTTRQVVLAGADAVIFVADSSAGRVEQNRWSLQNLRMNMRAKRLDPASVPVLFQFNKQDLSEAAPPEEVRQWLGLEPHEGLPSVATRDEGVLETFMASVGAMMERLLAQADERTRKQIDASQLGRQLERAFAPHLERLRRAASRDPVEDPAAVNRIVGRSDDLLQDSIQTSVVLSEQLAVEKERAARLDRESAAFRRLSDSFLELGASLDREAIQGVALSTAAEILNAQAVSLVHLDPDSGEPRVDGTWNDVDDPLLGFEQGLPLLKRMTEANRPCVIDDLIQECQSPEFARRLYGLKSALAVPVRSDPARALVAYAQSPDGHFTAHDIRFLATLAGHLSVGLERARLHRELAQHRDRLEESAGATTDGLRQAYNELRRVEHSKDRCLTRLSQETMAALMEILTSAIALRDSDGNSEERLDTIVRSAETAQERLREISRLAGLGGEKIPLALGPAEPHEVAGRAIKLAGWGDVPVKVRGKSKLKGLRADRERLSRALANLLENAFKFSEGEAAVELRVQPAKLKCGSKEVDGLAFSVLDRGPGVPAAERQSIFSAFEQGAAPVEDESAGAGLGLYEARRIAAQHGGAVEHLPRRGGGSEFRLSVPLDPAEARTPREPAHA